MANFTAFIFLIFKFMFMKSLYIISFFGLFLFFACKADKKTNTNEQAFISSGYYLRYLEEEKELKTEATFQQGDSSANTQAKTYSGVFFNNQEMAFKKLSDANQRYILNTKGDFPSENIVFSFINDNGQKESQQFSFSSMKNLATKGPASKSKGITVTWEGQALTAQESVICLFSDKNNRTTNTILKGPSEGSQINIPAEKLSALTKGIGKLYLVRKNRIRKDELRRSSFAVLEYYTTAIDIEVVE